MFENSSKTIIRIRCGGRGEAEEAAATPVSDEERLAFQQRGMQNGSYRIIVISANILNFAWRAFKICRGASL